LSPYLTNRRIATTDGIIAPRTLGLVISRLISDGMHEDIEITNKSMRRATFQLEIALRCDFADIFEVKSNSIVRRGRIATLPDLDALPIFNVPIAADRLSGQRIPAATSRIGRSTPDFAVAQSGAALADEGRMRPLLRTNGRCGGACGQLGSIPFCLSTDTAASDDRNCTNALAVA
jgi:glycogen debranching enzyme-like protein